MGRPLNDLDKNVSAYVASVGKPAVDFLHAPVVQNGPKAPAQPPAPASRASSSIPTCARLSQIPTPESESDSEDEFFRSNSTSKVTASARPSSGAAARPPDVAPARSSSIHTATKVAPVSDTPATQISQHSQPAITVDLTDEPSPPRSQIGGRNVISLDSSPPRPNQPIQPAQQTKGIVPPSPKFDGPWEEEDDFVEPDYMSDSSLNSGIPEDQLQRARAKGQSHFQAAPNRQPRILFSQTAPLTQQQTIGPLLTEKIGLLERKVAYLEGMLHRSGIKFDTVLIDSGIRQVMRRIDEFHAGEDGIDESDGEDPFFANPGVEAISSSPPRHRSHVSPSLRAETQIESDDDDDEVFGALNVNHQEASPYFSGKRGFSEDDLEPEMIVEVGSKPPPLPTQSIAPPQKYPWSTDVAHTLKNKFGLSGFRPNQLEAVTATLEGRDVVVLMPTGGGKSLCYQLPALVTSGKTRGTTVVISPLISLMQDQVFHLKNRNIEAEMINSQLSFAERTEAFDKLGSGRLQLVYLSPEMLSASNQMNRVLTDLYNKDKLARLVIDEAHCVSQWGHDFRPDYRLLERLKGDFCRTPIMALTATANDRVLLDIVNCVRPECLVLKQSFNRPNLNYEVVPKRTRGVMSDVASICKRHAGRSGIIYCHSRTACEETAAALRKEGIAANHYHAGLSVEERQETQTMWQEGTRCSVVCATIAFGMGIDKPDVRFVVHMTLPRNMEGYYQETGRAGRDGRRSWCTLFYNYADASMLMGLISRDENLSPQDRENHRNLLTCVVQYCENKTDCRRRQILQYFSESFDAADCHETCDNCCNMVGRRAVKLDVTQQSKLAVELLNSIASQKVTTLHCIDVMKGSKSKRILDRHHDQLPLYGKLSSMDRTELERLFHHLVAEKILEEYSTFNMARYPQTYLRAGPGGPDVLNGQRKVFLVTTDVAESPVRPPPQKRARGGQLPGNSSTYRYDMNPPPGQVARTRGSTRGRGGSRGGGGRGGSRGGNRYSPGSRSTRRSQDTGFVRMMQ